MRLASCVAITLALSHAVAAASPAEDTTLGGAVFTGPAHAHPTSLFINPAALAEVGRGWHVYIDGSVRLDQYTINRRLIDPSTGDELDGPDVSASTLAPGGSVAILRSGANTTFGIGAHMPMHESYIADQDDLRYHTDGGRFRQIGWFTVGGSLKLPMSRPVFIGASLSIAPLDLQLRFARDTALENGSNTTDGINSDCGGAPCGLENPEASEMYDVDVASPSILSTDTLALTVGAIAEVASGWWVALSYMSPPGFLSPLSLTGTVDVTGAPRDGGDTVTGEAEVIVKLPQTFSAGVRGRAFPGWEVNLEARYQNLSRHNQLDLRMFGGDLAGAGVPEWYPRYRGFNDVLKFEAGIEQQWSDSGSFLRFRKRRDVRVGARLRFESAAVDAEEISPGSIAGVNMTLSTGAEVRLGRHLVLSVSYGLSWFPGATATPSVFDPMSRLECVDNGFDVDDCAATAEGRGIPTAAGDYRRLSHGLRAALRYDRL